MPQNNKENSNSRMTPIYNLIILSLVIVISIVMLNRFTDIDWNNSSFSQSYASDFGWKGGAHYDAGEFEEAIADYTMALTIGGDNSTFYNNRAVAHNGLEEYDLGLADLNKAIEIDNRNAMAYANRCSTHIHRDNYSDAMIDCNEAIALNSSRNASMFAYVDRGRIYMAALFPRYLIAADDFTAAIRLYEDFDNEENRLVWNNYTRAYSSRGNAYYGSGQENYEEAIADYDRYAELTGAYEPYMEERIAEMQAVLDGR